MKGVALLLLCIAAGSAFPMRAASQPVRWGMDRQDVREAAGPDELIASTDRFLLYRETVEGYVFSLRYAFTRQGILRTVTYAVRVTGEEQEILGAFRLLERVFSEMDRRFGEMHIRRVLIEERDRTERNRNLYEFFSRIPGIREDAAERLYDYIRDSGKSSYSAALEWNGPGTGALVFATIRGTSRLDFLLRLQPASETDQGTAAQTPIPSLRDLAG